MVALASSPPPTLADIENRGLRVGTDGTNLVVGPRPKLTPEVIELIKANRERLLSLALGRDIVQNRPNDWKDPEPDVCHDCGVPAVGYSPIAWKVCDAHLNGGLRW
jgi:hypothetical protein